MPYPDQIFIDGVQLDQIIGQIVDVIVTNTGYTESDTEIIALRQIALEIAATTDAFVDLDSYPPGQPNTKALKERIVAALSGINIPNGTETVLP